MDALCLKSSISGSGIAPSILMSGCFDTRSNPSQVSAAGRSTMEKSSQKSVFSRFSLKHPLKSLWPGGSGNSRYNVLALDDTALADKRGGKGIQEEEEEEKNEIESGVMGQNRNWVFKILHVKSMWTGEQGKGDKAGAVEYVGNGGESALNDQRNGSSADHEECDACRVDEDDEAEIQFDRDSFSRMLRRVSLADARFYAQMSYLGNLAYSIPKIKPGNLLRYYGLRFVTSSMEKMEMATAAGQNEASPENQEVEINENNEGERNENSKYRVSATVAYQVAASAASYLHAQTKSILPFKFSKDEVGGGGSPEDVEVLNTDVASLKAATDSVTAVVAAKEEVKQAVADDLNSTCSSPCEWYICDDDQSGTRFFIIQGSESLASWQANLLFEPIQFEGFDVLVHRGIYEAAKGICQQMLPAIRAHLESQGTRATFRFTGHSLGGSLALLVNLMLLIRREVPFSSLLPVITFGAPFIMCGGDSLLDKLGLPRSHVQAITLHRDIVSRAFSCNYPSHVAELLKAVNGNFRNHSCLNNQNILYAPMGEILILQPDDTFSPHHYLLPPGSGLYLLSFDHLCECKNARKQLQHAQLVFLNSPHPLEILSDRSAYGSGGTILRDHDMNSYLKSIRTVIRQELNSIRKARRGHRRKVCWALSAPRGGIEADNVVGRSMESFDMFTFSGVLRTGKESWKRFSRLVASQNMHWFVVILFPARLLLLGAYSIIGIC